MLYLICLFSIKTMTCKNGNLRSHTCLIIYYSPCKSLKHGSEIVSKFGQANQMSEDKHSALYNKKTRQCDSLWLFWNCLQMNAILNYFVWNINWGVTVTAHAHQPWGRIHSAALCRSRGWCRTISCRHAARQRCSRCSCGHCRGRGSGTERRWSFHLVLPQWLE